MLVRVVKRRTFLLHLLGGGVAFGVGRTHQCRFFLGGHTLPVVGRAGGVVPRVGRLLVSKLRRAGLWFERVLVVEMLFYSLPVE